MDRRHTDREYEGELESLRERVLLMGAHVEEVLALAMRAYVDRNVLLARGTIELDSNIDQLELEIDEAAIQILARRQPVASDLRFITTTLKLVTDLERIGDLGVNICERVAELGVDRSESPHDPIPRIADVAQAMVHDALDAFVAGDRPRQDGGCLLRPALPRAVAAHDVQSERGIRIHAAALDR